MDFDKKGTICVGALVLKVCTFSIAASIGCAFSSSCEAAVVPSTAVWKKAEELGRKNDIDPLLIYSIACAESSLDDRADSGQARGIMQISKVAWEEVSKLSYDEAWKWETNMEVAAKYLHVLRRQLENSGQYSWRILAASYHYGPRRVEDARFRFSRMPRERNKIYKALFAGRMPQLPGSVPYREIDMPSAIQVFAKAEPAFSVVLPILETASYAEVTDDVPDVLEIVPLTPFQADAKIWEKDDIDELDEAQVLQPIFFHDPNLITPLVVVPDLGSMFVIKNLNLVENSQQIDFAPNNPQVEAKEENPPEVVVVEPVELDTSLGGIVVPTTAETGTKPEDSEAVVPAVASPSPVEVPPEVIVVEPQVLDTSPDGIVKPADEENSKRLGIPELQPAKATAPEE